MGGAVARNSMAHSQQQQQQQQYQQSQIAQAQAEANYANAQAEAMRKQQQQPVAEAVVYAQPPQQQQQYYAQPPQQQQQYYAEPPQQQQYAPPPQQYAQPPAQQQPPPDMGRSMLNQALSEPAPGGSSAAQDLAYLQKQLKVTQLLCEQAMGLYQQSMQLNQAAQRTNVVGNVVGHNTRGNAASLAMDHSRNEKMRASTVPAEKASQMLVDGFKRIPEALRLRYPQEMSRVGNVPAARLKVGSFGRDVVMSAAFGRSGENLNDVMMAKKIADNQREIGECMQVVREQLQLMQIVQARLEQDVVHAQRAQAPAAMPAVPPRPAPAAAAAPPPRPPPPAAAMGPQQLMLRAPHIVDEVAMAPYGIISVPQGAVVLLVQGSLQTGLGGHFQDYIEVSYQGKVGKISRLIVVPAAGAGAMPPPALF